MGRISLEGLEFFAYHGFYDEEQKIGNKYAVDVWIDTELYQAGIDDKLSETINYESLYEIIKGEMAKPSRLLENIGTRIINSVLGAFPQTKSITVTISKFNPPIGGVCHRAAVTLAKDNPRWKDLTDRA
ncbi:MAG TPA: dihydroneopterin aldolase [Cytophagales bacterium]|jgi:dihydroneopterin aldolase|nr:dihydroneopterin aldolase [Cytophagales bacterium]